MALEPCKVCRTLNSSEAEICLSCGYPTKGRKKTTILQGIAIALAVVMALPLLISSFSWIKLQFTPKPPSPKESQVSLSIQNFQKSA